MRIFFRLCLLAFVAAVLGAGYAAWYVLRPIQLAALPADFDIPAGASLRSAAQRLEQSGIPVGALRLEALARALGRTQEIQAGSYQLTEPVTPLALLDKLTSGDVTQTQIRLIEGWTIRQVRAALDAHADLKHESRALDDRELLRGLGIDAAHPEGLFFPDTYLFPKGSSDLAVLRRSHRALQRHLQEAWQARDPSVPYRQPYDALIMASIIEKETGREDDRPLVAGVLSNRLRTGMRLQADPVVIYGLGDAFDGNLRKADLLADGPYNTYTRAGLPPTPISMPGLASLRAAMRPAKTTALYYVGRGDGSSSFSRDLDAHNRAVSKYQLPGPRKSEVSRKKAPVRRAEQK